MASAESLIKRPGTLAIAGEIEGVDLYGDILAGMKEADIRCC